MAAVAVIGDGLRVGGYALAGAAVHDATDAAGAVAAWDALPADVALLLLDEPARAALAGRLAERPELVWTVVPG